MTDEEERIISEVEHWFALAAVLLLDETAHRYAQAVLKRYAFRDGTALAQLVEWAWGNDHDCHVAVHEIYDEYIAQNRVPPIPVLAYMARRADVKGDKGWSLGDCYLQNIVIGVFVATAFEKYDRPLLHGRASKPRRRELPLSICEMVSEALLRHNQHSGRKMGSKKVTLGARHMYRLYRRTLPNLSQHKVWLVEQLGGERSRRNLVRLPDTEKAA